MISVCMASYNGEKFIKRQLESILHQLAENDEIIISDDSSTDNTIGIITSLNDDRIRIIPGQKFRNPTFNFQNALKHAKGDMIVLSDQDDIWLDGKIEFVRKELIGWDMIVTDHSLIDENDQLITPSYFAMVPSGKGIIKNLKKSTYFGCCMAFKTDILAVALPFPADIPMHDMWLGFVSDLFFSVKFVDIPFTQYRKHDNNASTAAFIKSTNSFFKKLSFRVNLLKYIPILLIRRYRN